MHAKDNRCQRVSLRPCMRQRSLRPMLRKTSDEAPEFNQERLRGESTCRLLTEKQHKLAARRYIALPSLQVLRRGRAGVVRSFADRVKKKELLRDQERGSCVLCAVRLSPPL